MTPNHFEGSMSQRKEMPVLTPIQRLRKVKADRLELEQLKALDPPVKVRGRRITPQEFIDIMSTLLRE